MHQEDGAVTTQVSLDNGSQVSIGLIQPHSERLLLNIFKRLSPQSVYRRFLSPFRELPPGLISHLANVDYVRRSALIARSEIDNDDEAVAVARYDSSADPHFAEVALVVVDDWQRRGLGRILLRRIMAAAMDNGFCRFVGSVLLENRPMLRLLDTECEIVTRRMEGEVLTVTFLLRNQEKRWNQAQCA